MPRRGDGRRARGSHGARGRGRPNHLALPRARRRRPAGCRRPAPTAARSYATLDPVAGRNVLARARASSSSPCPASDGARAVDQPRAARGRRRRLPAALEDTAVSDRLVTWIRIQATSAQPAGDPVGGHQRGDGHPARPVGDESLPDGHRRARPGRAAGPAPGPPRLGPADRRPRPTGGRRPGRRSTTCGGRPRGAVRDPSLPPGAPTAPARAATVFALDAEAGELRFGDGERGAPAAARRACCGPTTTFATARPATSGPSAIATGPALPPGVKVVEPGPDVGRRRRRDASPRPSGRYPATSSTATGWSPPRTTRDRRGHARGRGRPRRGPARVRPAARAAATRATRPGAVTLHGRSRGYDLRQPRRAGAGPALPRRDLPLPRPAPAGDHRAVPPRARLRAGLGLGRHRRRRATARSRRPARPCERALTAFLAPLPRGPVADAAAVRPPADRLAAARGGPSPRAARLRRPRRRRAPGQRAAPLAAADANPVETGRACGRSSCRAWPGCRSSSATRSRSTSCAARPATPGTGPAARPGPAGGVLMDANGTRFKLLLGRARLGPLPRRRRRARGAVGRRRDRPPGGTRLGRRRATS